MYPYRTKITKPVNSRLAKSNFVRCVYQWTGVIFPIPLVVFVLWDSLSYLPLQSQLWGLHTWYKMILANCRVFHGVYTFHFLLAITWLTLQGKGIGVEPTTDQLFDDINSTKASTTEQPKELLADPTKDTDNFALAGTKFYLTLLCTWICLRSVEIVLFHLCLISKLQVRKADL